MNPKVLSRSTDYQVLPADVRAQMRTYDTSEDNLISLYIAAAVENIESAIKATLPETQFVQVFTGYPAVDRQKRRPIYLYRPPVVSVDKFEYKDVNGNWQTMTEGTDYLVDLDGDEPALYPMPGQDWIDQNLYDGPSNLRATFTCSMGTLPSMLKLCVIQIAATAFKVRASITDIDYKNLPGSASIDRMLDEYRNPAL